MTYHEYSQEPTMSEELALGFERREAEREELESLMQMRPGLLNHVSVLEGVLAQDDPKELEDARQAQIDDLRGLDEEFRLAEQFAPFFGGEENSDIAG